MFRVWTLRISSRPFLVGRSTVTWRSNRPGPKQRRVENVGPVGRRQHDHALARREAVHLGQDLVERLLAFVVAAAQPRAADPADGVDLVDEQDAGAVLLGRLEHVAHPAGADADEHLDELGARDREERHSGLAGDRAGQQRLARSRRPVQKHALGNPPAQPLKFLRALEELDDLLKLRLGVLETRHFVERRPLLRLVVPLRRALDETAEDSAVKLVASPPARTDRRNTRMTNAGKSSIIHKQPVRRRGRLGIDLAPARRPSFRRPSSSR